jgi:TolB protein|tara:strand:- start:13855 stop:15267 length:1413 start_codon:yes stop_codon:yes gene_type:complete
MGVHRAEDLMKLTKYLILILVCNPTFAELRIEVTKGVDNAVPIAIVPFEWRDRGMLPEDPSRVVTSDLLQSGRFRTLPADQMLSLPHSASEVYFRDWRMLNVEYLVIGHLQREKKNRPIKSQPNGEGGKQTGAGDTKNTDGDRVILHFELYNVFKQAVEVTQEITGDVSELRDMAHHVSDVIFEKLTGIEGAFSTQILYVTVNGSLKDRLFHLNIADADGHRPQALLSSSEPILSAAWAPDGTKIAYVSFERNDRPAIYIRDLATGTKEQLTNFPGLNGAPAWSPDGKSMAMVLSRDGNPEIYIMELGSRQLRRVTRHYAIDTEPSWRADGKALVFTSNRGGKPQIYQITLSNLKIERLTFEGDYNARARILPDGKNMILVHRRNGVFHIALLDLKRGRLRVLTETALDESPSIAPNGSMLIYATLHRGQGILAAVSVDGGVKFRLPSSEGDVREPAWSPRKRRIFEPNK